MRSQSTNCVFGKVLVVLARYMDKAQTRIKWLTSADCYDCVLVADVLLRFFTSHKFSSYAMEVGNRSINFLMGQSKSGTCRNCSSAFHHLSNMQKQISGAQGCAADTKRVDPEIDD